MEKYISIRDIEMKLGNVLIEGIKENDMIRNISNETINSIKISADELYSIAVKTNTFNSTFFNRNDVEDIYSFIHLFSFVSEIAINSVLISHTENDSNENIELIKEIVSRLFSDLEGKLYTIPKYDLQKLRSSIRDNICTIDKLITYIKDYNVQDLELENEVSNWIINSYDKAELNYSIDTKEINIDRAIPNNIIYYCKYLVLISVIIRFINTKYVYKFCHNGPYEIDNKALCIQTVCARMLSNII